MRLTRADYRAVFLDSLEAMHKLLRKAEPLLERPGEPDTCKELGRLLDLAEFQAGTAAAALEDYCQERRGDRHSSGFHNHGANYRLSRHPGCDTID